MITKKKLRNTKDFTGLKCCTETFKSCFIPSMLIVWNSLNEGSINSIINVNESVNKNIFCFSKRENAIKHSQMRVNCSKLNTHLCYLHVLEAPDCRTCELLLYGNANFKYD